MSGITLQSSTSDHGSSFVTFNGSKSDNGVVLYPPKYALLISVGFLRQNSVNPQDIATIIEKYIGQSYCTIESCIGHASEESESNQRTNRLPTISN